MRAVRSGWGHLPGALAIVSGIAYLIGYSVLSGSVTYSAAPPLGIKGIVLVPAYIESQTYTGPATQVIGEGFVLTVRWLAFGLGIAISVLLALNVYYLMALYVTGRFKSCLVVSGGSFAGAVLGFMASAFYLCCGWAPSLILLALGIGVAGTLGLIPGYIGALLLGLNAWVLRKRASG
jgi:hypothetical protein